MWTLVFRVVSLLKLVVHESSWSVEMTQTHLPLAFDLIT
jgi:hypothetical protein